LAFGSFENVYFTFSPFKASSKRAIVAASWFVILSRRVLKFLLLVFWKQNSSITFENSGANLIAVKLNDPHIPDKRNLVLNKGLFSIL
jgi:hypothetical protein